ncbi:MAG: T9SS type A sorting domain-containing protein [Bacteroidia bacterium]|nr:T9SS type A sorting domain-containing protein [Bacteroidia bacterium]
MKFLYTIFSLLFIFAVNNSYAQIPSNVPTNGLNAWYNFNGNGNDESVNANNANNLGATFVMDRNGNPNSAASFNGSNQYMQVAAPSYAFSETGTFTYSVWINKPNTDIGVFMMTGTTAAGNFISLIQGANDVKFGTNQQQSAWTWATTSLTLNTWDHYVATYDNKTMNLYKNGVFQVTATYPYTGAASVILPLYIGRGVSGNYYEGSLDDIGIWNRVLNPNEIANLYSSCTLAFTTQPDSQSVNMNLNAQYIAMASDTLATYQWQEDSGTGFADITNGGQYSGATDDTLNINGVTLSQDNNQYRCIITSGNCTEISETALLTVINNTSIGSISESNPFSIYPNPASSSIQLQVNDGLIYKEYKIYNLLGTEVMKGIIEAENSQLDISRLDNGVYMFQIANANHVVRLIME